MPKICYTPKNFRADSLAVIVQANKIIDEYQAAGYMLTLRQLYYQHVSRGLIPNTQESYKRLGSIINDGRLAGLIDWTAIEDRTRNLKALSHWDQPSDIVSACAAQFRVDKWQQQPTRVEVWVEKEALAGVCEQACRPLDVPTFACKGYVSQSEMWSASQRLREYEKRGQRTVILHLGDHDPSGIDMTRDIQDRLKLFRSQAEIKRIALNWDQIQLFKPPPNPAKDTDARFAGYRVQYGDESWELDALDPKTLSALITKHVEEHQDLRIWTAALEYEARAKTHLERLARTPDPPKNDPRALVTILDDDDVENPDSRWSEGDDNEPDEDDEPEED